MAPRKKSGPARAAKTSGKTARLQPNANDTQVYAPSSELERFLVDKMISGKSTPSNGTAVENLLYLSTPKVSSIGYSFGFVVGREMFNKLRGNSGLQKAMRFVGMQCTESSKRRDTIVTSQPCGSSEHSFGSIHLYESGVIAGFLSARKGIRINAKETECSYGGAVSCRFVAAPSKTASMRQDKVPLEEIMDGIARYLSSTEIRRQPGEYRRILALVPLLKNPMNKQIVRLLTMSGSRIARYSGKPDAKRIIGSIASYFGAHVAGASISESGKSIIKLRYESYNSIYPYVSMPNALIAGFLSAVLDGSAEINLSANNHNSYTATITVKKNRV